MFTIRIFICLLFGYSFVYNSDIYMFTIRIFKCLLSGYSNIWRGEIFKCIAFGYLNISNNTIKGPYYY